MSNSDRSLGERLAYIEAQVAEGIPQRARMISQLDRIEQNQSLQLALTGRVDRLEEQQGHHETKIDDLMAQKNRAMGVATLLGVMGGSIATWIVKKLPLP